jgi:hypothetical protein
MPKRAPRDRAASKATASPPFDLEAVKAANRKHRWERYGRPVAPAFKPHELDQLNALREFLPNGYRKSDAAMVKACFEHCVKQFLDGKPIKRGASSRRESAAERRWERAHS